MKKRREENIAARVASASIFKDEDCRSIDNIAAASTSKDKDKVAENAYEIPKKIRHTNFENTQYDSVGHFPDFDKKSSKSRCKMNGCNMLTHVFCVRCKLHFCFVKKRNCFLDFHRNQSK